MSQDIIILCIMSNHCGKDSNTTCNLCKRNQHVSSSRMVGMSLICFFSHPKRVINKLGLTYWN